MTDKPKRKQKAVEFHKEKDGALIEAIEADKISFNTLVNKLLRDHYQLPARQRKYK